MAHHGLRWRARSLVAGLGQRPPYSFLGAWHPKGSGSSDVNDPPGDDLVERALAWQMGPTHDVQPWGGHGCRRGRQLVNTTRTRPPGLPYRLCSQDHIPWTLTTWRLPRRRRTPSPETSLLASPAKHVSSSLASLQLDLLLVSFYHGPRDLVCTERRPSWPRW